MSAELPFVPVEVTPDNREFFDGLASGRVRLPRCDRCQTVIWYPRRHCPSCGSGDVSWFDATGRGAVHSFTIVRRGQGEWAAAAPYVIAYVELEEGPRVLANIVGSEPDAIRIGGLVEAVIETGAAGPPVLRFRPA